MTRLVKSGKVREVYALDCDDEVYVMVASDRLSAFDTYVCNIKSKGQVLNQISAGWFERLNRVGIHTHFIAADGNASLVKRCKPILLEVIVRRYLTGSLWRAYTEGRNFYGLPEGLKENHRFHKPIVTPTTKGEIDEPILPSQILSQGYVTGEVWYDMVEIAQRVFEIGEKGCQKRGITLVDTKYEFGFDKNNRLTLIDEVHTPDSSRFRYNQGENKASLDKDVIRKWLIEEDKMGTNGVIVPEELLNETTSVYLKIYSKLTGCDFPVGFNYGEAGVTSFYNKVGKALIQRKIERPVVQIIAGSVSDEWWVEKLQQFLELHCKVEILYASAHKDPYRVLRLLESNEMLGRLVYVTVAGRSNALSGVVAANTTHPVIACPPFKDKTDMMVNINSTLQMPSKVPVMTILEPENVAEAVRRMFCL